MGTERMSYELVYASCISADLEPGQISDLVQRGRIRNRELGVTSLLVFDGACFCQLLEGDLGAVTALVSTIQVDARHSGYTVLHAGSQPGPRRFPGWNLAFGLHDGNALGDVISRSSGLQMADYLQLMPLSRIDFGPPEAG
jgi:hypothetical protein